MDTSRCTFFIDPDKHKTLKLIAVHADKTVSEIVRDLVESYLLDHEESNTRKRKRRKAQ